MDRVEHYRQIVRTFLEEYAQANESVTAELIFDEKRDRNLLVHVGSQEAQRIGIVKT